MYRLVAIGGTFDRFHKGHKAFILRAFEKGERVVIGVMSDRYVEEKLKIQNSKVKIKVGSYRERREAVWEFLKRNHLDERAEVVKIDDLYGDASKNPLLSAILVTRDSYDGAVAINKKREEAHLRELKIIKVPLVNAYDRESISSTRIRMGEIDREGNLYRRLHVYGKKITSEIRIKLKKPLGLHLLGNHESEHEIPLAIKEMIADIDPPLVITIGDEVTKLCNLHGIHMDIAVVDFHVKRERVYKSLSDHHFDKERSLEITRVANPAGTVTIKMMKSIEEAIKGVLRNRKQRVICVAGEEDLSAIPALLLAPLDSLILYGQPLRPGSGQGVVAMIASEEKKRQVVELLTEISN